MEYSFSVWKFVKSFSTDGCTISSFCFFQGPIYHFLELLGSGGCLLRGDKVFFFSRNVFGDFYMSCRRVFNNSWSQKKLRNGSSQFYPSTGTGGQDILNPHPPLSGVYKCPEPLKIGSFSLNRSLGLRKYQGMGGHCPCWTWKSHTEATPRGMPSLRDNECSERGSLA